MGFLAFGIEGLLCEVYCSCFPLVSMSFDFVCLFFLVCILRMKYEILFVEILESRDNNNFEYAG